MLCIQCGQAHGHAEGCKRLNCYKITIPCWSNDVVEVEAETAGKAKYAMFRRIRDVVPVTYTDFRATLIRRGDAKQEPKVASETPKVRRGQLWENRFTGTKRYVRRVTRRDVFWTFFDTPPLIMEHSDDLKSWYRCHIYVRDYVVQKMRII